MSDSNTLGIPQRDNLSSLPPELLAQIFKHVSTPIAEGLSRSLISYTRSTLYRKIHMFNIRKFKKLMTTVIKSPSIGSQIVELSIEIGVVYSAREDQLSVEEAMEFLGNLKRVKIITLNFTWLIAVMSSLSVATSSLPLLNDLSITSPPFPHRNDCYETESFKRFNLYPSLRSLRLQPYFSHSALLGGTERDRWITINGDVDDEINRLDNRPMEEVQSQVWKEGKQLRLKHRIKELYVEGISVDYEVSLMVYKLTGLKKLSITDSAHGPYILNALKKIANPLRLRYLKFDSKCSLPFAAPLDIYPHLIRFQNLSRLTLSAHLFHPELFKFLRDPLPLNSLALRHGTAVTIKDLKSLILPGANKLSSLKNLRLDVVRGKISKDRIEEIGEAYYGEFDEGEARVYPGWELPLWKAGTFDEEGLISLMRLANDAGIQVIGSSVEAIGISEAYIEECNLAEEYDQERHMEEGCSDCTDCFESDESDEDF